MSDVEERARETDPPKHDTWVVIREGGLSVRMPPPQYLKKEERKSYQGSEKMSKNRILIFFSQSGWGYSRTPHFPHLINEYHSQRSPT